jgi:hypothetical protein
MDAASKFVFCWNLGMRDAESGKLFMQDVADRLANRVQLTTDGHKVYLRAVAVMLSPEKLITRCWSMSTVTINRRLSECTALRFARHAIKSRSLVIQTKPKFQPRLLRDRT